MSDPISDIKENARRILNERWICKYCAFSTNYFIRYPVFGEAARCPECGSLDWHYTYEDVPVV